MSLKLNSTEHITLKTTEGVDNNPRITGYSYYTDNTFTTVMTQLVGDLYANNYFLKLVGKNFSTNSNVFVNDALLSNVEVVSDQEIRCEIDGFNVKATYSLHIENERSEISILSDGVIISEAPEWQGANLTETPTLLGSGNIAGSNIYARVSNVDSNITITGVANTQVLSGVANARVDSENSRVEIQFLGEVKSNLVNFIDVIATDEENQSTPGLPVTYTYSFVKNPADVNQLLLDGNGTQHLDDISDNNVYVTKSDNPAASGFNPYTQNPSWYFDGSARLRIQDRNVIPAGTGDYTIEFWCHPTSLPIYSSVFDSRESPFENLSDQGVAITFFSSGAIEFFTQGNEAYIETNGGVITTNQWHHVAVVRESSNTRVHVNGIVEAYSTAHTANINPSTVHIGSTDSGYEFYGYVSDLRVVTGDAIYKAGASFDPPSTKRALHANTTLYMAESPAIRNAANTQMSIERYAGNVQVAGFPALGYSSNTLVGSTYFDGSNDYLELPNDNIFERVSEFTFEAWVYPKSTSWMLITSLPGVSGGSFWWEIWHSASDGLVLTFGLWGSSSAQAKTGGGAQVPVNKWTHVVVQRRSDNTVDIYFNGVLQPMSNGFYGGYVGAALTTVGTVKVGYGGYYTAGAMYVNDFRFSDKQMYSGTLFTPPLTPLQKQANTQLLLATTNIPSLNNISIDDSPTLNTVALAGAARTAGISPYSPTGHSVYFNGSSALTFPDSNDWYLAANDFTIEFWTKTDSQSTYLNLAGQRASSSALDTNSPIIIGFNAAYYWNGSALVAVGTVDVNDAADGNWHHVAIVRKGDQGTAWLDGVRSTINNFSTGFSFYNSTTSWGFGQHGDYNGQHHSGLISNFRLIKGRAVYDPADASITVPTAPFSPTHDTMLLMNGPTLDDQSWFRRTPNATNGTPIVVNEGPFRNIEKTKTNPTKKNSIYFNNATMRIPSAGIIDGPNSYAMEGWFWPITGGTNFSIVAGTGSGDYDGRFTTSALVIESKLSTSQRLNANPGLIANTWNHIAVAKNNGVHSFWVNGNRIQSVVNTASYSGSSYASVGTGGQGIMSNFRIVQGSDTTTVMVYDPTDTTITVPTEPLESLGSNTKVLLAQELGANAFLDFSGNDNHPELVVTGAITAIDFSPWDEEFTSNVDIQTYTPEKYGGSLYGNAQADYADVSYASGTTNLVGDFSLEAWVYMTRANAGTWGIIDSRASGGTAAPWIFAINGSKKVAFFNGTEYVAATTLQINRWYHVAVARVGSALTIYVNGKQDYYNASFGTGAQSPNNTLAVIGTKDKGINAEYGKYGYVTGIRVISGSSAYRTPYFTPPLPPLNTEIKHNNNVDTVVNPTDIKLLYNPRPSFYDKASQNDPYVQNDVKHVPYSPFGSNHSMLFDGVNDRVDIADNDTAFNFGSGDFTFEAWVFPTTLANDPCLITQWGNGDNASYIAGIKSTGYPNFVWPGAGNDRYATSGVKVELNRWSHVVWTRESTTLRIFINGKLSHSSSIGTTALSNPTRALQLGCQNDQATFYGGYMSCVRISKGISRYTAEFTPPTKPFTEDSYTSLLCLQKPWTEDESKFKHTLSKINGPVVHGGVGPFNTSTVTTSDSYSYRMDGTSDYITIDQTTTDTFRNWWTEEFTIECWIYVNSWTNIDNVSGAATQPTSIVHGLPTDGTNYWSFGPRSDGTVAWYYWNGSGPTTIASTETISLHTWNHIAMVKDSNGIEVYVNGVGRGSYSSLNGTPQSSASHKLLVGALNNKTPNIFINNLRIVKGTTAAVYDGNFTPPSTNLEVFGGSATKLLLFNTNTFADGSDNNASITFSGDIRSPDTFNPFGYSQTSTSNYHRPKAIAFDGTGDTITITATKTNDITSPTRDGSIVDFTIEFWMYTSTAALYPLISQWRQNTGFGGWSIGMNSNQTIYFSWGAANENSSVITTTKTVRLGEWNHIAVTRSGSTFTVWINGAISGTYTSSTTRAWLSTVPITIGHYLNGNGGFPASVGSYFNGYLDDIRITKGTALYTDNFVPPNEIATKAISGSEIETLSYNFASVVPIPPVQYEYLGQTATFTATGSDQTWVVPDDVYLITAKLWGAGGGNRSTAGAGGYTEAEISVTPGETITVVVGVDGSDGSGATSDSYGGGGGAYSDGGNGGRQGGGRSALRSDDEDILTAGGGGGSGYNHGGYGGGGLIGRSAGDGVGGGGGTQTAGGVGGSGSGGTAEAGVQYTGGISTSGYAGGGGGGGWYGGGGSSGTGGNHRGGGGGSGFVGRDGSSALSGDEWGDLSTYGENIDRPYALSPMDYSTYRYDSINGRYYNRTKCLRGDNASSTGPNTGDSQYPGSVGGASQPGYVVINY